MSDKVVVHVRDNVKIEFEAAERPQLAEFFKNLTKGQEISGYEIARAFQIFDRNRDLPREMFDVIVSEYKLEIENGNDEAMSNLGSLYYIGHGCEQDYTKAIYYYEMAAKLGNEEAIENLGYCYYYGRNVKVDYKKAFHYFALGAFTGRSISLYKIGDMYKNGYYVEKNLNEAFKIYKRAYDIRDEYSLGPICLRLGRAYLSGEGVENDPQQALKFFQLAENYLYEMVSDGDEMYFNSLKEYVDSQDLARIKLSMILETK